MRRPSIDSQSTRSQVRAQIRFRSSACALAASLALATACSEPPPPRPSLLLITTSSLRAAALPCYGDGARTGAAICALADRGALFVWAFATTPSVAPSAATLMTSQSPREHGVGNSAATFLRSGATTLAGELQKRGYATAAFIAVPELNRSRNLQLGFDVYEPGGSESLARSAERVAARASAWIETRNRLEQPYFVWAHFPATSTESTPPLRGLGLSELDGYVRLLVDSAHAGNSGAIAPGIAFAALAGSEAADSGHARPLDVERVRVPLIWSPPGGVVQQRFEAPIPLLDLAPTLLHSAGLAVPSAFSGEDLLVGPLPPAAPGPTRPIELEGDGEIGLVLSRRYYAKRLDGKRARTSLLSNTGRVPVAEPISTRAREVREHERLLGELGLDNPLEPTLAARPEDLEVPLTQGEEGSGTGIVGKNFSPEAERAFLDRSDQTPSP